MKLNKFTEKAQEAVLESQNLAQSLGQQTIEPEHLLLSLIRQSDGIVPQVLQRLNQSPEQLAAVLERDLNARPRVSGSNVQVGLGRAANDVLEAAESEAKSMRDEYVSAEHILLALAKSHTPVGTRPNDYLFVETTSPLNPMPTPSLARWSLPARSATLPRTLRYPAGRGSRSAPRYILLVRPARATCRLLSAARSLPQTTAPRA